MSGEMAAIEPRVNPRTRRVRQAILDAAVEVLLSRGAQHVTASRVAEQANVARTTIYRHWPDQPTLLLATIDSLTAPHSPAVSRGPLEVDLRADLHRLRTRLVTRDVRAVFAALALHAVDDSAFAAAQRRFVARLAQPMVDTLRAAQERGDLDASLDCEFEATVLTAPLLSEHLLGHNEIEDRLLDEVGSRWLAAHDLG